jgi:gliding motility-associated-like protein
MTPGTSYTVTASNGSCSSAASTSFSIVAQFSIPIITLTPIDPSVCNISDGNIVVNGTGAGTVTWSGQASGTISSATLNYSISNLAAGNYSVYFIDQTTGCQSSTVTATLNNPGAPILTNPGNQTACDFYILPAISGTNLSGSQSYWTQTGGNGTQYNAGDIITSSTTLYVYDQNGNCSDEEMFVVTINYTPVIVNPGNQTACVNYSLPAIFGANLSGSQAYFNNSQANGGTVISGIIASNQTIYIYDSNGTCSDEESFTVTINSIPTAYITGESTYCQGDDVADIIATVTGSPNYTVYYTLDGIAQTQTSSTGTINLGNNAGVYVLDSISDALCTNTALSSTQTILVNSIPNEPIVSSDTNYCSNATPIDLTAQGTGTFSWYSDEGITNTIGTGSSLTPSMNLGTTNYYVTQIENGCESPAALIQITVQECAIIIPTAITPDNDGVNDEWQLENIDKIYPKNIVTIYNRWGNLIYQSIEGQYTTAPWNGKINNDKLPVGSYYYIIEYNDGVTNNKTGIVTLIE